VRGELTMAIMYSMSGGEARGCRYSEYIQRGRYDPRTSLI